MILRPPSTAKCATWRRGLFSGAAALFAAAGCAGDGGDGDSAAGGGPPDTEMLGGDTTVLNDSENAFGQPAANLSVERQDAFFVGNALFRRNWVAAPASTEGSDGLGPVFNAVSCSACHLRDGRGRPPLAGAEPMVALLFRLGRSGAGSASEPDPVYGDQLNDKAILGVPPEGTVTVTYEELPGAYADGEPYSLRRPTYEFSDLAFGPLAPGIQVSPRVAPALIGLGLLEAVPEDTLVELADDGDRDGDGISGRLNRVFEARTPGTRAPGRFGWKANVPTVEQQTAAAFLGDIGITSTLFPAENCGSSQAACLAAPAGGAPELDDEKLASVTFYSMTLAVPARRGVDDPLVRRGERLFRRAGCDGCHLETLVTGELDGFPELSGQEIHPFTDLLLHDLGEPLADGRTDFEADGREWRTAPLWGIGLIETVNTHLLLLHDGRARGFAEAILWHGGEAEAAREAFRNLRHADREALIKFLESL